jgi:hypothetical protein
MILFKRGDIECCLLYQVENLISFSFLFLFLVKFAKVLLNFVATLWERYHFCNPADDLSLDFFDRLNVGLEV